jgi:hypothetical protein
MIEASAPKPLKVTRVRAVAAAAIVAAVAAVVFLVARGGNDNSKPTSTKAPAVAASLADLQSLAGSLKHQLFWVGPRTGDTYELTKSSNGNVWVRYLPAGVQVDDSRASFLTIGTYPQKNAYDSVKAASKRTTTVSFSAPNGGLAVEYKNSPSSVYVAFPGSSLLIEVFDPSPATARAVVKSGQISPIG